MIQHEPRYLFQLLTPSGAVELISMEEATDMLGVSRARVRQLVMRGVFRSHPVDNRTYFVERRQVAEFANGYRKRGPKPTAY